MGLYGAPARSFPGGGTAVFGAGAPPFPGRRHHRVPDGARCV